MNKKKKHKKKPLWALLFLLPVLACIICILSFEYYIDSGAKKLIMLEKSNKLSRNYGYVWQEINTNLEMKQTAKNIVSHNKSITYDNSISNSKESAIDFPSLDAVRVLNSIKTFEKSIKINDRNHIPLAELTTTHNCINLTQLNSTLLKALLTTEDSDFYTRKKAYDFSSLLRASINAAIVSVRTRKLQYPRGSSTIYMQAARFLLMKYDNRGYAYAEKSLQRKISELKLAQALKLMYTGDEILTLYINHCVSAGRGMTGFHDISKGLFGVTPDKLNIAQSLYLSRLVKWNRHVPKKIVQNVKTCLPLLAESFNWDNAKTDAIKHQLDSLHFRQPVPFIPKNSYLIDLANEYWKQVCLANGMDSVTLNDMDISNPESIIRGYGSLSIDLTLDYRLQKALEKLVNKRGFGNDTTIQTDIKIGSEGANINGTKIPPDTLRKIEIIRNDTTFTDPVTKNSTQLKTGDTLVCNIRYKKNGANSIRRSCFYYKRDSINVPGQYYAYAIIDSRTRKLLAYCSRDRLGSRLNSLLVNRTPNGSSLAKPLIYALAYDFGIYAPTEMASDNTEIPDTCKWTRKYSYKNDVPVGMIYLNTKENSGYAVHNHSLKFDGYDFLFNHLSNSNNILAVETMYRLDTDLSVKNTASSNVKDYLQRIGQYKLMNLDKVTGPQIYGALASVVNDKISINRNQSQTYSTALGTLELTLYEQMHLFNVLYDNSLVVSPSHNPSLFINEIRIGGEKITISDTVKTRKVFSNLENIRPVHLALHKRLVSAPSDKLYSYDIGNTQENSQRLSNFAKSGTTDDIIRPFNADVTNTTRTNYGLWNAVLRIKLKKNDFENFLSKDPLLNSKKSRLHLESVPAEEQLDITLACIGECNTEYTGKRDGKTLHGYVSTSLLHTFGVQNSDGFYKEYEQNLIGSTSDKVKYATQEESDLSFLSRTFIKLKTGIGSDISVDDIAFEKARSGTSIRLRGKNYRKLLKFAPHLGDNSKKFSELVEQLKKPQTVKTAKEIIDQILLIEITNKILERDLQRACKSLIKSLEQF